MSMFISGLTSITFRALSCQEIIDLMIKSGLASIEWGGDVHVPHGDLARAGEVMRMTADNGLRTSSYGSYYHCGPDEKKVDFKKILETALALKAPLIRVWAGRTGSREISREQREAVVADSRRVADLAFQAGIRIGFEFHRGSLTDDAEETMKLMGEIGRPNVGTYWQPPIGMSFRESCASLRTVIPHLQNIHVFHWGGPPVRRMLLAEGMEPWRGYLKIAGQSPGDHHVLLEFVQNDDPAAFLADARALIELVN